MRAIKNLTDDQCDELLAFLSVYFHKRSTNHAYYRYRLMYLLMLDAGLRVGELVQLCWHNVIDKNFAVEIISLPAAITKTKESRQVPLSVRLMSAINDYWLLLCGDFLPAFDTCVFRGTNGRQHITTRSVQLFFKRICKSRLNINVTPHMFRHTFATRMMRVAPLSVLQQALGHKRLSSTGIYLHPTVRDTIKAIKAMEDSRN